jgi:hypothetical protein
MFESAVLDVPIGEFGEGVEVFVLVKLELTGFNLSFGVSSPVIGFLLAFKVIADGIERTFANIPLAES